MYGGLCSPEENRAWPTVLNITAVATSSFSLCKAANVAPSDKKKPVVASRDVRRHYPSASLSEITHTCNDGEETSDRLLMWNINGITLVRNCLLKFCWFCRFSHTLTAYETHFATATLKYSKLVECCKKTKPTIKTKTFSVSIN